MRVIFIFLALAGSNIFFFGITILKGVILLIFFAGLVCAVFTKD